MPLRSSFWIGCLLALCAWTGSRARAESAHEDAFRFEGGENVSVLVEFEILHVYSQLVTTDGFVSMPFGGSLNIKGKTMVEANEAIIARAHEVTGLRNPRISISLNIVPTWHVFIQGEVQRPQRIEVPRGQTFSLAAALAQVGGVTADADVTRISLQHVESADNKSEVVDGSKFGQPGSHFVGPLLRERDLIIIPRAETFAVIGEVLKPGIVTRRDTAIQPGQPVRLSQVLAAAGGTRPIADRSKITVVHTDEDGHRQSGQYNQILALEQGDIAQDPILRNGDQIVVSTSEGVYISGRVKSNGIFYPVGGKMTVSRLITMAGGFDQYAKRSTVLVVRKDKGDVQTVDMKKVMELGQLEGDLQLDPGDRVFVPESGF